jgi:choline dehydrogenase-like flavoprotein
MPDPSRSTEHVDVLIVGSGPAGSTYARTIGDARPDVSILMIEVGPHLPGGLGEHTMNMSDEDRIAAQLLAQGPDAGVTRPALSIGLASGGDGTPFIFPGLFPVGEGARVDGEFGLTAACMSSGVGGMGVHWGGSCPRPTGSERISFIDAAELDAAYARAEQLLAVSKHLHDGDELLATLRDVIAAEFDGDAPDAAPVGFMPVAVSHEGGRTRTTGTGRILGDLADRVPGFELRAETLARRIVVDGGVAVGALLEDRSTGEAYEVRARRVVVCADSLRTPQLLFASGVRPPALGHHLNDHLQVSGIVMLRPEYVPDVAPEPSETIGMPVDTLDRVRPPAMGSVLVPYVDRVRTMQGQLVPLSRIGFKLPFGEAMDGVDPKGFGVLAWYGAKDIQYSDAVEFDDSRTDFYGMPAMTIRYTLTDTDQRTLELLRANLRRNAELVGVLLGEPAFAPGGSSLHYQGTVRMGLADDGSSVCDTYCRVWGVEHLYVGGNGVIPTSTAANPTLTNVAIATRAASELARGL